MASEHIARLSRLGMDDRIQEVAAILHRESGFVEWSRTADGYEIDDYNCMFRGLTGESSELCIWHRRIIEDLVGVPATKAASEGNGTHCRCILQPPVNGDVSEGEPSWPHAGVAQLISQEVHT
jgi:predicted ArsR family transcriptional regulator